MLAIAFILISIQYFSALTESKKIAFENGIDEDEYDILRYGLWLYIIPPILTFLIPIIYFNYYLPIILFLYMRLQFTLA